MLESFTTAFSMFCCCWLFFVQTCFFLFHNFFSHFVLSTPSYLLSCHMFNASILESLAQTTETQTTSEQRHTVDMFRCRARAPSPTPKSHVCSITFVSRRCQLAPRHDLRPFGTFIGFFSCVLCVEREFDLVPPRQRLKCSVGILRAVFKGLSFVQQRLDIHKSRLPEAEKNFSVNA